GRFHPLGGVGEQARVSPFVPRPRPAELGLLPRRALLRPPHRRLTAADTLLAQGKQLTRPCNGLQRALLYAPHSGAEHPAALIQFSFTLIDLPLPLGQRGLPPVRLPFPPIRRALPLIRRALALSRRGLPPVRLPFPLIRRPLPLIRHALALSRGLTLS